MLSCAVWVITNKPSSKKKNSNAKEELQKRNILYDAIGRDLFPLLLLASPRPLFDAPVGSPLHNRCSTLCMWFGSHLWCVYFNWFGYSWVFYFYVVVFSAVFAKLSDCVCSWRWNLTVPRSLLRGTYSIHSMQISSAYFQYKYLLQVRVCVCGCVDASVCLRTSALVSVCTLSS